MYSTQYGILSARWDKRNTDYAVLKSKECMSQNTLTFSRWLKNAWQELVLYWWWFGFNSLFPVKKYIFINRIFDSHRYSLSILQTVIYVWNRTTLSIVQWENNLEIVGKFDAVYYRLCEVEMRLGKCSSINIAMKINRRFSLQNTFYPFGSSRNNSQCCYLCTVVTFFSLMFAFQSYFSNLFFKPILSHKV